MKQKTKVKIIFGLSALFMTATAFSVSAQTGSCPSKANYNLEINLPGIPNPVCGPAQYLSGLYTLAIGIAAALATVMIVYAGIIYATSGDNASKQKEARSQITQAVLGLVILLASYLILHTINPDLVNLGLIQNRIVGKSIIDVPSPSAMEALRPECLQCDSQREACALKARESIGVRGPVYANLLKNCDEIFNKCWNDLGCFSSGGGGGGGGSGGGAD
ncbi:MAG TPA: hypothetical protein P5524_02825 [Candidatus Paceibacterota bacterium]|nr:hypothetical protein [Candidatus Paceibacterota bacterium]